MCNAVAHRSYRGILSAFATVEIVKTCKNAPLMRYFNMYFLVMTANALKYKCTLVRSSCRSGFYRVETGISVVWFDSGIWISGSSSSQFVTQVCFFSNEKFVSRKIETRFWFQKNPNVGWNHICVCLKKYKPAWGNCFYVWLFTNAVGNQDKVSRKAKLGLERAARLEVHLKLHESLNNYGVKLKDGLRTSLRTRPTAPRRRRLYRLISCCVSVDNTLGRRHRMLQLLLSLFFFVFSPSFVSLMSNICLLAVVVVPATNAFAENTLLSSCHHFYCRS